LYLSGSGPAIQGKGSGPKQATTAGWFVGPVGEKLLDCHRNGILWSAI
jgi:hypothetical protein